MSGTGNANESFSPTEVSYIQPSAGLTVAHVSYDQSQVFAQMKDGVWQTAMTLEPRAAD